MISDAALAHPTAGTVAPALARTETPGLASAFITTTVHAPGGLGHARDSRPVPLSRPTHSWCPSSTAPACLGCQGARRGRKPRPPGPFDP